MNAKNQSAPRPSVHEGKAAAPAVKSSSSVELQRRVAGINPLLGAANVLLALVPQLRATTTHADPAGLHQHLLERVKEFEAKAHASGVKRQQIVSARYVLCTFIDEVIAATPWGASGTAFDLSLLQEFHDERWGGEKAFKLLAKLGEEVEANIEIIELFYICIALGFEGRYRGVANGRSQLDAISARLAEVLRPASRQAKDPTPGPQSRTLSVRWTGLAKRGNQVLSVLPLWVVFALGGVIVLATVLFLNARLDSQSRSAFRQIHAVPAALRAEPSGTATVAARPRLVPLLRADAADGAIEVRDEPMRSVVTVPADTLFSSGSAQVEMRRLEQLKRIAQALADAPGQVVVIGHTDSTPVSSLQFPSSWHLTRDRARAVMAVLAQRGARAERMRAEGRADAEPIAANDTPVARARNRRIEIELLLPRPDG